MNKSQLKSGTAAIAAAAIAATASATPLEIFAPGKWTGIDGRSWEFTADQVREIAESYDPALFSAPLVVGHPKHDDPAWGWAASLKVDEASGKLLAVPEKVAPEFAEAVAAGRYRKISAAFYGPDHPGNPKPGQFYLRHIGFLGGVAPAVKGLAPAAFADGDEFIEFALEADELRTMSWLASTFGRIARGFRDFLIEREGQEVADRMIPDWEADAPTRIAAELNLKARAADKDEAKPGFAAPDEQATPPNPVEGDAAAFGSAVPRTSADARSGLQAAERPERPKAAGPRGPSDGADAPEHQEKELARREADLAAREAAFATREAELTGAQKRREDEEDAAFCDTLIKEGRLAPGLKPQLLAFAAALKPDGDAICFAEGQAALPARPAFRAFLDTHLGQSIHFAEAAPASEAQFAQGRDSDAIAADISAEMDRAAASGRHISAAQAAAIIRKTNRS